MTLWVRDTNSIPIFIFFLPPHHPLPLFFISPESSTTVHQQQSVAKARMEKRNFLLWLTISVTTCQPNQSICDNILHEGEKLFSSFSALVSLPPDSWLSISISCYTQKRETFYSCNNVSHHPFGSYSRQQQKVSSQGKKDDLISYGHKIEADGLDFLNVNRQHLRWAEDSL